MKNHMILLLLLSLLLSCEKQDPRKVVDNPEAATEIKTDKKSIELADLPILIDSTQYMLHPIGTYTLDNKRSEYFEFDSYRSNTHSVSHYNGDRLTGNMSNIKFQNIGVAELKSLTNLNLNIRSAIFLRGIFEKTEKGYFLFEVIDKDTNLDGRLDANDLRSLYISHVNGVGFKKISPNHQDASQWKLIIEANTLFFKTIEDTDANGEFDEKDQTHYFQFRLTELTSSAVEYFPI